MAPRDQGTAGPRAAGGARARLTKRVAGRLRSRQGADWLNGRIGHDTLSGGAPDFTDTGRFVFDAALNAADVDTVTDFVAGDDLIVLQDAVFKRFAGVQVTAATFAVGERTTNTQYLTYDPVTGELTHDSDGVRAGQAEVLVATLAPGLALAASDFEVI